MKPVMLFEKPRKDLVQEGGLDSARGSITKLTEVCHGINRCSCKIYPIKVGSAAFAKDRIAFWPVNLDQRSWRNSPDGS
jgi:hypothetical protein